MFAPCNPWPEPPAPHLFGHAEHGVLDALDAARRLAGLSPIGWGPAADAAFRNATRRARDAATRAAAAVAPLAPYLRLAGRRGRLADTGLFPPSAHEAAIAFARGLTDGTVLPPPSDPPRDGIVESSHRHLFNTAVGPRDKLPDPPDRWGQRQAAIAAACADHERRVAEERTLAERESYDDDDMRALGFERLPEVLKEWAGFLRGLAADPRWAGPDDVRREWAADLGGRLRQGASAARGWVSGLSDLPPVPGAAPHTVRPVIDSAERLGRAGLRYQLGGRGQPDGRRTDPREELRGHAARLERFAALVRAADRPTPPPVFVPPVLDDLIRQGLPDFAGPPPLRQAQRCVLLALRRAAGPLAGRELAGRAGYTYDSIRRHLKPLQRDGLIRKTPAGYVLTESGRQLSGSL